MRRLVRKLIDILDGTPAEYGKKPWRGQSVVEMAFITPIIIILIIGVVEIGWFANNYLILLEVTRVGARRGAVLTGDNSPLNWDDRASMNPQYEDLDPFFTDPAYPYETTNPALADEAIWPPNSPAYTTLQWGEVQDLRLIVRNCPPPDYVGFYNLILCQMTQSLDPIKIKLTNEPEDQTDDIIISVFAIQMVENTPTGDYDFESGPYVSGSFNLTQPFDTENLDEYDAGWIPVVVGRYPASANECNVFQVTSGAGAGSYTIIGDGEPATERDPFDFINDGLHTTRKIDWSTSPLNPSGLNAAGCPNDPTLPCYYPIELSVDIPGVGPASPGWDPPDRIEVQRGFNYTGYHRVDPVTIDGTDGSGNPVTAELYCFGSDWDIYEVQELMKGRGFEMSAAEKQAIRDRGGAFARFGQEQDPDTGVWVEVDTKEFLANQGLVLVEIYWQHELLLDFPVFSPVYGALGGDQTTIYVWSAFPAPGATPDINFDRPWQSFYAG